MVPDATRNVSDCQVPNDGAIPYGPFGSRPLGANPRAGAYPCDVDLLGFAQHG